MLLLSAQVQRERPVPLAVAGALKVSVVGLLTEATVVTVERFKFNGNRRLSTEQLQAAVTTFANRPLNPHDLKHLTDAVSQEYRKTGWVVQTYIPRQNLDGPELVLQVIESIPPNKP